MLLPPKTENGGLRSHPSECGEFDSLTRLRNDQGVRRLPSMLALAHASMMDNLLMEERLAIRSSVLIVLPLDLIASVEGYSVPQ